MKKTIITVIATAIICITGTSLVAYKLKASEVSFDNSNTELNSNDVQSVLDELVATITNLSIDNVNVASVEGARGYVYTSPSNNDSVEYTVRDFKIIATIKKTCQGFVVTNFFYGGNTNYGKITLNDEVIYNDSAKNLVSALGYSTLGYTINKLDTKLEVGD